jgi:hypothetical protein
LNSMVRWRASMARRVDERRPSAVGRTDTMDRLIRCEIPGEGDRTQSGSVRTSVVTRRPMLDG